jgi:hypothetical protein
MKQRQINNIYFNSQADSLNLTPMAHINTENKADALILSRSISQNQKSQNTATLKEALHEFIGTAIYPKKIWDTEKYRCTKKMHKTQIQ